MASLEDARARAQRQSKDGCVRHVASTIAKSPDGAGYAVVDNGYYSSDFIDGCTVESYVNGRMIWQV